MKKIDKNQRGFSAVEALLILVIVGVIAGVGYYVWNKQKNQNTSSSDSPAASVPAEQDVYEGWKDYKSDEGNFSVKYPADWKLDEKVSRDEQDDGPDIVSVKTTVTSPDGVVVHLNSDDGGRGGDCSPESGDKAFAVGNACSSHEYLTSEPLAFDNVYASVDVTKPGEDDVQYETQKSSVKLVTYRFMKHDDKASQYGIGMTDAGVSYPLELNKPLMGAFFEEEYFLVRNSDGEHVTYIYAYTVNKDKSFLQSQDAETVKNIFRSLKVQY